MRRRVVFRAFVSRGGKEPRYDWYADLVDPNGVDEFVMGVQIEHMNNRLQGGWRNCIPFCITYHEAEMVQNDYQI